MQYKAGTTMNYFGSGSSAQRYSKCRPDFHSNTIRHIKEYLRIRDKFDKVLDVACGSGLSTKALLEIAVNVYGTDSSGEMLNYALESDKISYSIASAEHQPFPDATFELITVSSGVHWFDIDLFLAESYRLLKDNAYLVLYDNYFSGDMDDHPNFRDWYKNSYLSKFPPPPRNNGYDWSDSNLGRKNFTFLNEESFKNTVPFNKEQLICYFTTQSNITAAVEARTASYQEVEAWLHEELAEFFESPHSSQTFIFGNWIRYIRKGRD